MRFKPLDVALGVLLLLTFVSWRLCAPGHATFGPDAVITASVLATGFVKCRLIMSRFMEVRTSPHLLRWFSDAWLVALFGAIAILYASTASAQDVIAVDAPQPSAEAPAPASPPVEHGLGEIVVTAQRREESLQDVPISITVFDQEALSNANVANASDLALYTPSLGNNNRLGSENASFSIRGFTQTMRTTASVATYFAEVVAPRGQSLETSGDGAGPGAFFDLQSVQVLKGPQGTLFGRNTTGGAILIVPQKPAREFGGYAELSGGDLGARRAQAVLNLPVNDRLRVRFGIDDNRRRGFFHNVTGIGADRLGDVDFTAGRLSAIWDVTDAIENYTILSGTRSHTNGNTARMFACNPSPIPTDNLLWALTGVACPAQLAAQEASGQDGYYDLVSTIPTPITKIREWRVINTTTWRLTDTFSLTNFFGYAHLFTENGSDVFGTQFRAPYEVLDPSRELKIGITLPAPGLPTTSQQTYVEEIRAQGVALGEQLNWQAGLYYENSRPDGWSGYRSEGLLSCETASLVGDPSGFNCFDPLAGAIASVRTFEVKTKYLNRAVYAQGTYDFAEALSVTGGLRYTNDRTSARGIRHRYTFIGSIQQPEQIFLTHPKVTSDAVTGMFEISVRPVDDLMTYAKYTRGYRQGNVNTAADAGVDTWDPEKVDTYEIGAKATLGGLVPGRISVAAFYNDLTDMQLETGYLSQNVGSTTTIFNAGKARIKGVEAEVLFRFFDDVSLSVSYSYLDTRLLEQEDQRARLLVVGGVLGAGTYTPSADEGDTLPFAADHTAIVTLGYRLPLPQAIGDVDLGATYVYTGNQRTAATSASPFAVLPSYEVCNLNLTWKAIWRSGFDFAVFGTNVLDQKYDTFHTGTYNSVGFESRQVGQPRMVGARLRYSF